METSYPFGVRLLGSKGSISISPFPRYCNTSASESRPTSRGKEWRGLILPSGIRNETLARDYLNGAPPRDRKSTRLNSSHVKISYAVFCSKTKSDNAKYDDSPIASLNW